MRRGVLVPALAAEKASSLLKRLFCVLPHLWIVVVGVSLFQLALLPHIEAYDIQRYVQFGLFWVSLLLFCFFCYSCEVSGSAAPLFRFSVGTKKGLFLVSIAMMFIGVLVSLLQAKMPIWALLDFEYSLIIIGMTWILFLSFQRMTISNWEWIGRLIVLVMWLYSLRTFIEIFISFPFSDKLTVTPGFTNIRMYADLAVVIIPLSWLALVNNSGIINRASLWLVNVFWMWILVLTEARSGILSLSIAVSWVAFRYSSIGRQVFGIFLSILFVSVVFYILLPVMSVDGWSRDVTSSSGRILLWELSWQYFQDSFPFGIGGMMFAADGRLDVASPHNIFFVLLAEWGGVFILGLVLMVSLIVMNLLNSQNKQEGISYNIRVPVVLAAIAALVNLQFSGAHIGPFSSVALMLAFGASLAVHFSASPYRKTKRNYRFLTIGLFLILFHASFLGYELHGFSMVTREACAESSGWKLFPRFWVQGRLDCGAVDFES